MSNVKMPEPVAWGVFYQGVMQQGWAYNEAAALAIAAEDYPERKMAVNSLVTTDQAEAYAAAKVREALEVAAQKVAQLPLPRQGMDQQSSHAWERAAVEAARAIRTIVSTDPRPGQP